MTQQNAWINIIAAIVSFVASTGIVATLYKLLEARLPLAKNALIQRVVETVVRGVEQSSIGHAPTIGLADRKKNAIAAAESILKSHGITVNSNMIALFVEAAVALLPPSGLSGSTAAFLADQEKFLNDTQATQAFTTSGAL